jgi:hypothetical protein
MIRLSIPFHPAIFFRWWIFSLFMSLSMSALAQNADMDSLSQARAAIAKQEWTKAESLLLPQAQNLRQNPFAAYEIAQVYENTNRLDAAKKIYRDLTTNSELIQRQPTMVIRAPYASSMVSLLALAQARLNAIEAKQLAALPPLPKPAAGAVPPNLVTQKSAPALGTTPALTAIITAAIQSWADAWANKDLPAYYACYEPGYRGSFPTSESWKKKHRDSVMRAKAIELDFKNVEMTTLSPTSVKVQFAQTYTANGRPVTTKKTLVFVLKNGRWLIESEADK